MIEAKVYKLKEDVELNNNLTFKKNQEFEVVNKVVYMGGFMIPPDLQQYLHNWIITNPKLFFNDTRNWNRD